MLHATVSLRSYEPKTDQAGVGTCIATGGYGCIAVCSYPVVALILYGEARKQCYIRINVFQFELFGVRYIKQNSLNVAFIGTFYG